MGKPETFWLVAKPDRTITLPNSVAAGPGLVNIRITEKDGAVEYPNCDFIRRRWKVAGDFREATTEEIAVAKKKLSPPAQNPPKPTDPPRA